MSREITKEWKEGQDTVSMTVRLLLALTAVLIRAYGSSRQLIMLVAWITRAEWSLDNFEFDIHMLLISQHKFIGKFTYNYCIDSISCKDVKSNSWGECPFRGCIAWYGTEAFHMDAYILVPYCITPTLEEAVSHSFRGSIYLTFPLILAVVDGYAACLLVLNIGCGLESAMFDISLIFFFLGIVQIAPIDWILKDNQRWLKIFACQSRCLLSMC